MLVDQNLMAGTKKEYEDPLMVHQEEDFLNKRTFKDYLISASLIATVVFMLCLMFFVLFILPIILIWS
ncbi:MAG: hypothetical protein K2N42_03440 [Anaeroplasmataceae bacterium]|nr:hypothetical protein [Anaeroplasmataceae bacterium]